MSTPTNTALQKQSDRAMEFTPFGAADKIKLSIEIVKNFIAVKTRSGKTCDDRDAMRFMMLCQAQRLNPFAGDAFLTGYDRKDGTAQFSLITAHVAFLKRAESSEDFEGMESGVILQNEDGTITEREGDFSLKGENVVGGWAKIYRRGRKPTYRRLSIEQRRPAYETPFWEGAKAAEQIVKCAEADGLRATFPTLLGGMRIESEPINIESVAIPQMSEAITDSAPQQPTRLAPVPATANTTPQQELETLILNAGFDLESVRKFGEATGNITNANELKSFAEINTDEAKRLLRAQVGFLNGLKKMKAEVTP